MNQYKTILKCEDCLSQNVFYDKQTFFEVKSVKEYKLFAPVKFKCKFCRKINQINKKNILLNIEISEVNKNEKMALNRTVKEVVEIEEKRHEGSILNVEERKSIYQGKEICYIDFTVSVDDMDNDVTLRVGYPDNLSNKSGLGIFLLKLGMDITPNSELDIEDVKGKKISYTTVNQETDKGIFARIDKKSIMVIE